MHYVMLIKVNSDGGGGFHYTWRGNTNDQVGRDSLIEVFPSMVKAIWIFMTQILHSEAIFKNKLTKKGGGQKLTLPLEAF